MNATITQAQNADSAQSGLKVWILAIRPKTLTAAIAPILVGTALVKGTGFPVYLSRSFLALFCALLIQIGTNLINDASDFEKGADTAARLGPQRVTQSGLLKASQVMKSGLFCFLLAAVFAIPLLYWGGWPILVIGVLSLFAGYAYTAGPYPLAYLGLGDLFVLIFFGWIAVGGIYFLHTGEWNFLAWVAGTQVGLLGTVLIAINNFRDSETDILAQKMTLAVRFGSRFARAEIAALLLLPFLAGIFWWKKGLLVAGLLPVVVLPLAWSVIRKIYLTRPGVIYNQFLAQSALVQLLFGVLLSIGFIFKA